MPGKLVVPYEFLTEGAKTTCRVIGWSGRPAAVMKAFSTFTILSFRSRSLMSSFSSIALLFSVWNSSALVLNLQIEQSKCRRLIYKIIVYISRLRKSNKLWLLFEILNASHFLCTKVL